MEALVKNAADPRQVKRAKSAEKRETLDERADLRKVDTTGGGRGNLQHEIHMYPHRIAIDQQPFTGP